MRKLILFAALVTICPLGSGVFGTELPERIRQPVALVALDQGRLLAVFNRRAGSVSLIDPPTRTLLGEHSIAARLSAACSLPDGRVLALDDLSNELLLLLVDRQSVQVQAKLSVPAAPVGVVASPDGRLAVVASHWARRLTVVSLAEPPALQPVRTIDLPFAPRRMLPVDAHRVLVADAFGGWLALVDPSHDQPLRCRELHATHNLQGMALGGDPTTVYLAHQMLNYDQPTTGSNVHWGDVMSNVVRRLSLSWFVSDEPEQTTAADLYYLGYPDRAAGDPTPLVISTSGSFVVGLAGVDQVAISDRGLNHFQRPEVGRRPVALWLDEPRGELFVANQLDDTVTVVDLARARVVATISLGPQTPLSLADQGEQLFYDARLSSDGWYSCHSCHTDGHTNGRRSDTFGDGEPGAPKQVPSLLGTAETAPWAWNGKQPMLEAQIRKSLETTMRGAPPTTHQVQALAAYVMSLSPPPSVARARGQQDASAELRGELVFHRQGCADCHQPPAYTSSDVYDVGLTDANGQRQFNPPSLLGVGHRQRLLHDGSAATLREALRIHPHGRPAELNDQDWSDLETFVESL